MSEELKLCPFCGREAIPNSIETERVNCFDPGCYNAEGWRKYGFSVQTWQSRPLEDALRKQLDIAMRAMSYPTTDEYHSLIISVAQSEIKKIGSEK